MSSVCNICCDENATSLSKMCSNNKCSGIICDNCVSKIITFKGIEYDNKTLSYECPYCKSSNNKLKKHFSKLTDNDISLLITNKTTELLYIEERTKLLLLNSISDQNTEIDILENDNNNLEDNIIHLETSNKQLIDRLKELKETDVHKRIKDLENIIIQNKLDIHKVKIDNNRLRNILSSNKLTINKYENWMDNATKLYNDKNEEIEKFKVLFNDLEDILNQEDISLGYISLEDDISLEEDDIPIVNLTSTFNSISIKKKYHCDCCNKTINDSSKYGHFKSKKHIINEQRLNIH